MYGDNIAASSFGATSVLPVSYKEPTREEIEIAKAKVAEQFAHKEKQGQDSSLNPETFTLSGTDSYRNIEISKGNNDSGTTSSIIDNIDKSKTGDNLSLLATPARLFTFLKNFFTK